MDSWRRAFEAMGGSTTPSAEPWYRRPDAWLLVGVILLPFGWVLALCRMVWVHVMARRGAPQSPGTLTDTRGAPRLSSPQRGAEPRPGS